MATDTSSSRRADPCPLFSDRLRAARTEQSLSLRQLAARIGVSASLISQVETGKVQPSINTLYALARELGLSIDDLLLDEPQHRDGDSPPGLDGRAAVVRAAERRVIQLNPGVRWERLTTTSDDGVDFFHVVYEAGAASMPAGSLHRHAGREWGYVMSGRLRVELDAETHELGPGDSIRFDSTTPHRLHNPGTEEMHAIWFVVGRARDFRLADPARPRA
jgi:transcriptional regulator with XRE-family HTH domain